MSVLQDFRISSWKFLNDSLQHLKFLLEAMGDGEALKCLLLLFVHLLFGGMRYLTRTVCGDISCGNS